jgi:hypothetical protein
VILVDTGPLIPAGNRADEHHTRCVRRLAASKTPLATVVAEIRYLLERAAGPAVEAEFLPLFSSGYLELADLTAADLDTAAELVEQYADFRSASPTRRSSRSLSGSRSRPSPRATHGTSPRAAAARRCVSTAPVPLRERRNDH